MAPAATNLFELSIDELDRFPTGVITLDRAGTIVRYNRAESTLSRLEPIGVIGKNFFNDVAPCTALRGFQGRFEAFALERDTAVERFDWVFRFRWGHQDVTITLLRRELRDEIHLVVAIRSMAATISETAVEPVTATYRSETVHRILVAGAELEAFPDPIMRYAYPRLAKALSSEIALARDEGRSYMLRVPAVAEDGSEKDVLVQSGSFETPDDAARRRAMEDDLWRAEHLDPLTLLPNRRLLMDRLTTAIGAHESISVCFVDLDRFKHVNDSAGHAAGDSLLRLVAKRIARTIQPTDLVSRITGDEFVVVLFDRTQSSDVDALVGRLLDTIGTPYTVDRRQHTISASIGVASYPTDGRTAEALLGAADVAMYRAKATGSATFRRFTNAMRETADRDRALASELSVALQRGEIVPYYQTIVDARMRGIVGAEALARWEHPLRGTLAPADFIAIAERSGLVGELGAQILRAACITAKRWNDAFGPTSPMVSVNVSPLQFRNRGFVAMVREILAETRLPPAKLELELTESLIIDRFEETMLELADLKLLGISLSIGDFGTGYSALAYLKYFPIDTVKLDRAFVEGIGHSLDDEIVKTIVALATTLRLNVIAEGVETAAAADRLTELDCGFLQGFYFSRPTEASAFEGVLAAAPIVRER